MEAPEAKDYEAGDNQQQAKKEECAAKIRHGEVRGSGSCQKSSGFAEKLCGLTRLSEDAYRARQFVRVFADALKIRVKPGEHDDAAGRLFFCNVGQQSQSISVGHRDITKKQMGFELAGTCECLICGVGGPGFKPALAEHESERVGNQTIIVDDQNALHCGLLESRFERCEH
jgi:hypothetical protein